MCVLKFHRTSSLRPVPGGMMNERFYVVLLLVTGATPRECLVNAHMSEKEIDRMLLHRDVEAGGEFKIRLPGTQEVELIVSPLDGNAGWGVWYSYLKPTFDTFEKATNFGIELMRQIS